MTEAEARSLLERKFEKYVDEEFPHYWIGDVISQDETGFLFQATVYADGDDPAKICQKWGVDAKTKVVELMIM